VPDLVADISFAATPLAASCRPTPLFAYSAARNRRSGWRLVFGKPALFVFHGWAAPTWCRSRQGVRHRRTSFSAGRMTWLLRRWPSRKHKKTRRF